MNWKIVLTIMVAILYGFIGTEIGSNNVSNHPLVSDTCQRVAKVSCSTLNVPPGAVDCGGEVDRLNAQAQSEVQNISVGMGVLAKKVDIQVRTLSRQKQQVEITCRGLAIDPLWPVNEAYAWFEVKRP